MNAIERIDAEKLAASQGGAPTEEQVTMALQRADLPVALIRSHPHRAVVGRSLASGVIGNILAKSLITNEEARTLSKALVQIATQDIVILDEDLKKETIQAALDSKVKAAEAWAKVNNLVNERDMLDIKAIEVEGIVSESDRGESVAPQQRVNIQFVTPGPVQVNGGKPSEGA